MKKIPLEEIQKQIAKLNHTEYTYDYSTYNGKDKKMKMFCHHKDKDGNEHGEFCQSPYNHLKGHGCPLCAIEKNNQNKRLGREKINKRLYDISGGLYRLSNDNPDYKNNLQKLKFVCKKHGTFYARSINLLKGEQCPYCRRENLSKKMSMGIECFSQKLQKIHGNNIEICKDSVYVNNATKIKLICHKKDENGVEHGEFWQLPTTSLNGCECLKCKKEKLSKVHLIDSKEIEKRFKKLNGNTYVYDFTTYKDTHTKMRMICPEHGEFWQTPHLHLSGQGCPYCQESKMERQIQSFLKNVNISFSRQKTFEWLKYKKHLFLDFYLPDYNIAIECQGEQHFNVVEHFKESFEICQIRDKIKKNLCKENNIKLFYYSNLKYDSFLGEKVYHTMEYLINAIKNYVEK